MKAASATLPPPFMLSVYLPWGGMGVYTHTHTQLPRIIPVLQRKMLSKCLSHLYKSDPCVCLIAPDMADTRDYMFTKSHMGYLSLSVIVFLKCLFSQTPTQTLGNSQRTDTLIVLFCGKCQVQIQAMPNQ